MSSESSTVEQETRHHHADDRMVGVAYEGCDENISNSELELGLGLSIGGGTSSKKREVPRIFTAKDLPSPRSSASSCSSLGLRPPANNSDVNVSNSKNNNGGNCGVSNGKNSGTKRAASPTAVSQVVGWPPIRAYRMNSMANQAKSTATGENDSEFGENKGKDAIYGAEDKKSNSKERVFVKVNMDGVAIGRKVDLNAHSSYESLAQTLEDMFTNRAAEKSSTEELILMPKVTRPSKLLDGSSDFVLTYEDKDGDWMLVGDVPWGMFVNSVKRLRIMRTSEANGLAPRSEERSAKERSRPI